MCHRDLRVKLTPVDTRRHFNVYKTSMSRRNFSDVLQALKRPVSTGYYVLSSKKVEAFLTTLEQLRLTWYLLPTSYRL